MVEALALKIRQVELIGHESVGDMPRQPGMPLDGRQLAGATALVSHPVTVADAQGEMRVVVEEERGDVVVENKEQHVRTLLRQPALHRLVAGEDRRPDGVLLFVGVEREADSRCVRGGDTAYDRGHWCS